VTDRPRGSQRFFRALLLVWQSSKGWTLGSAGLIAVQAALSVAALALVKLVIDTVTDGLTGSHSEVAVTRLVSLIAVAAGVALLSGVGRSLDSAISEIQRDLVSDHVHGLVNAKAADVDAEYYENPEYYDGLHRAQVEAPGRATTILATLTQAGRSGLSLAAIAGLLVTFDWRVAAILVLGDVPGAIVRIRSARAQYRWQRRRLASERRARYFSLLLSARYCVPEIRTFDLGELLIERFKTLRRLLRRERQRLVIERVSWELGAQATATIAMYGAYGFVAYRALAGAITLGDLVMVYAALQRGQGFLHDLLFGLGRLYEDSLFLGDLSEFLALRQRVAEPARPLPVPEPLDTGIAFEHVGFQYPGAARPALVDVNLVARPGERIAIVGPNGSGKTTLVKLLCRLYDPSSGRVTADGIPISCFARREWRRQIGAFFQDHGKYYLSARENIWFGNIAAAPDDAPIVDAARRSGAHARIERLPHGYETVLGAVLEDGAELSAGEWQKVALARTHFRAARVVVFDEPTNVMDALAEQAALETIWSATPDRITILISHRLSTVRLADRIYVLDGGRVVEWGTHEDLMCLGGTYAELFAAQAADYK